MGSFVVDAVSDRRTRSRPRGTLALKRRVDLLVRIGGALSLLVIMFTIAAWFTKMEAIQLTSLALLGIFVFFLSFAILHVWRLTNLQLCELQVALDELRTARSQADEANMAKSRFLATVSHELRTPMNGVIGMAGLLLDTKLSQEQRSYVEAVDMSGRSLLSIIDELLDAAKAESGEMTLHTSPFNLTEMIESSVELLAARAHAKSIEIACYVSPNLPELVDGDEKRLRQVVMNIAGNAIKFTTTGSVLINAVPGPGKHDIEFSVSDTGHGIPEHEREAIFERFRQSSSPDHQKGMGTGLGLSISRHLVELMGGKIKLESEVNCGSTFSFTVSLPLASLTNKTLQNAPQTSQIIHLSGFQVVLAIPDGAVKTAIAAYLHDHDATCVDAGPTDGLSNKVVELSNSENHGRVLVLLDPGYLDDEVQMLALADELAAKAGLWVLLRPEERRIYRRLMEDVRIGYLLKPTRRASLLQQLKAGADTMEKPVNALRKTARRLRTVENNGGGLRIMLVEDNRINMLLATKILKSAGHEVVHMLNGAEAVCAIEDDLTASGEINYDLILMDIFMPGIDGIEATVRIRALEAKNSAARKVPILALTANARNDDQMACTKAGMDGYLSKPFDRADLEQAVEGYIRVNDAA